ncbi:MAG: FtsX-like permease family protein [Sedimentisphaerales bacterium]|nr:FtsX-like permease family protein [Sedimentisphaerales bacterium]
MTFSRLVRHSLGFYWRTNAAVVLAVAVATAVLTGALAVGDSVRYTLGRTLGARLGRVEFAVMPQGRFFRAQLADDLKRQVGGAVAPVLQVSGIITNEDGSRRINKVRVLGVDGRFYAAGSGRNPFAAGTSDGVVLSESVVKELTVVSGDEVVLRVEKSGLLPRDVPLVSDEDRTVASRLKVQAIADESAFGRFDLQANQAAPYNVFVPRSWLAERIGQPGRVNLLLAADLEPGIPVAQVNAAVRRTWQLADAGLELRHLEPQNALELRSGRIFIDEPLGAGAMKVDRDAAGVLTYFVNEIRLGDRSTPYSMVAAVGGQVGAASVLPPGMRPDEIVINQWLADDLDAGLGDTLHLAYYVIGPNRRLRREQRRFTVVRIVPLDGPAYDANLMPAFPGLADVENCRDWKPGIPIDLDRIRPKDEKYWDDYRGTPKAFITLEAGQAAWHNRYGSLTAVRYPWREGLTQELDRRLRDEIDPATVGLLFQPVRQRGLQAGREGTDFGELFLGLSMFLIASAIILTGLLFVFGVESRSAQVGLLLAVGWPARRVKRLFLVEGGLIALIGTIIGVGAGLLYTALIVYGLSSFWGGAVAGSRIYFCAGGTSLFAGGLGGLCAALFAIWITLRRQTAKPVRQLLTGNLEEALAAPRRSWRGRFDLIVAVVALVIAVTLLAAIKGGDSQAVAGAFFGAGALLLLGSLGLSHAALRIVGSRAKPLLSLGGLGVRSTTRRSGRSLAVIGLLACGVFMVVAVGANRRNPLAEPQSRTSGTGGFALYGESSVGILYDLNSEAGRKDLRLAGAQLADLGAVQFRVREGDDASCLNLNRAQQPRLLGVQWEALKQRGAFPFVAESEEGKGWELLRASPDDGFVPAIGDEPTVKWGLGKKVGDELEYTDEMGRPFRVRIVGVLGSSVLQGSLIIAENEFTARFPSVDGYQVFLIDAPADRADAVAQELSSGLRDYGLMVTPARERLAVFGAVENTYLSIFAVLGSLGLMLGSIGLGLVVLRNMLERRGELAMLRAVGFDKGRLLRMVFYEHWPLCLMGLGWGVVAAVVAVVPALRSRGGQVPLAGLLVTIVAIGLSGAAWVWLAGTLALRGKLLDALRHE